VISLSQRPLPDNTRHSQQTNIHAPGGIRTHNHRHRQQVKIHFYIFTACLNKSLAKYSQTLIQHHPHFAPMQVCKQKFPSMWYFNILPPSTYCHPRYTTTNWGEQVVALYCTILFMWWD